jgi:hypothetical protein
MQCPKPMPIIDSCLNASIRLKDKAQAVRSKIVIQSYSKGYHMSPIVIITAIESVFGFLLTSTILYLVLSRGKQPYHYIFSAILIICANWNLGIFLIMIRNDHLESLSYVGQTTVLPCIFIPALIFHFAVQYTRRQITWALAVVWISIGTIWVTAMMGVIYKVEGYYEYGWGNFFRVAPDNFNYFIVLSWCVINLSACWLLYNGARKADSRPERRHYIYIIAGFLVLTFSIVKAFVSMGMNVIFLLPLGMFFLDIFNAIIGVAIIKEKLLDISVIIKKASLYTILAGTLIFIYSLTESFLVTFIGDTIGAHSTLMNFISISVGIAVLIPVKNRIERLINRYFIQTKLEF